MKDINSRDFKLMLESGYLDRRTCANSNERKAIASLVKTTFGYLSLLINLKNSKIFSAELSQILH